MTTRERFTEEVAEWLKAKPGSAERTIARHQTGKPL